MKETRIAKQVQDFIVLPLRIPALPGFSHPTTHYLYLRQNAPRLPTEDTPQELFLVNVPADATETNLRTLFADQLGGGRVESVEFECVPIGKGIRVPSIRLDDKRGKKRKRATNDTVFEAHEVGLLPQLQERLLNRSGATAVVKFIDRESANLALREARRAAQSERPVTWLAPRSNSESPVGLARYKTNHELRYPDPELLQASIDAFMTAFAAQEAERTQQIARQRSVPDEDGFITVVRGGRTAPAREHAAKLKEEEFKKREKSRTKEDFYRFQLREVQKKRAIDLVRGFEDDRKRVDAMRKRRGRVRPD